MLARGQCAHAGSVARTAARLTAPARRHAAPIRGEWDEEGAGWLEMDTVALCGGALDDRHAWMLDAVDIRTDWTAQRALENRGQHCTLLRFKDLEESLPFPLRGVDSDNGGEFINHHLVRELRWRKRPVLFTRARPYRKNENAHVEQRNWTHVRQHFGSNAMTIQPRCAAQRVVQRCVGPVAQPLPAHAQTGREKAARGQVTLARVWPGADAYARVLLAEEVTKAKKVELRALHARLNPFQLGRARSSSRKTDRSVRLLA